MSGQSQTSLRAAIANKTASWYHCGLADDAVRVQVAEDAWYFLKNHYGNANAKLITSAVPLAAYPGTTRTLRKWDMDFVKYTTYNSPVGHGISNFPLDDPAVLAWLFDQSLLKRP